MRIKITKAIASHRLHFQFLTDQYTRNLSVNNAEAYANKLYSHTLHEKVGESTSKKIYQIKLPSLASHCEKSSYSYFNEKSEHSDIDFIIENDSTLFRNTSKTLCLLGRFLDMCRHGNMELENCDIVKLELVIQL
ncbi:CLUMA_CG006867, isoform A [Clunio marinus]|uniref:CLUMA_CG006867, isoform A n=1 Tax=Clunio marinus TaxID=568069 RepID=A0A1J1I392_9DIPT|nr:CLUMA_CG006867, isoform A [Clunio marinus]